MEKINEQENILGDPPPSRPPTVRLSFKSSLRRAFSATPTSASNSLNRKSRKASVFTSQSSTNSKYLTTLTSSQDFVIRHVALITLRSYVPKSLDDLATLYLYQEQEHNKKQPNYHELWDKLFHIKKKSSAASSPAPFKIFGAPLQDVVDRDKKQQTQKKGVTLFDLPPSLACFFDENAKIPSVVQNCVLALLQSGNILLTACLHSFLIRLL
jgi:hypothetical protein